MLHEASSAMYTGQACWPSCFFDRLLAYDIEPGVNRMDRQDGARSTAEQAQAAGFCATRSTSADSP